MENNNDVLRVVLNNLKMLEKRNDELMEKMGIMQDQITMEFAEVGAVLDRIEGKLKQHDVKLRVVK